MFAFWASFNVFEKIFSVSAGIGSLFFILRAIGIIAGFVGSSGVDLDGNGIPDALEQGGMIDLDGNGIPDALENNSIIDDLVKPDIDNLPDRVPFSKKILSLQNLSAFVMMFGWVGLAMMRSSGFGVFPSMLAALVAGYLSTCLFYYINKSLMKLNRCGNARIVSAIGKIGKVYLRIPADDDGQIEVEVDGRLKICDAISSDNTEIKTGTKVLVIDVQNKQEKEVLVVKVIE